MIHFLLLVCNYSLTAHFVFKRAQFHVGGEDSISLSSSPVSSLYNCWVTSQDEKKILRGNKTPIQKKTPNPKHPPPPPPQHYCRSLIMIKIKKKKKEKHTKEDGMKEGKSYCSYNEYNKEKKCQNL